MNKTYDVFIAYHGTEKKSGGTYESARELSDYLYKNGIYSFVIEHSFFNTDSGIQYQNTTSVVGRSNLFILVANNNILKRTTSGVVDSGDVDYLKKELNQFESVYSEADGKNVLRNEEYKSRCNIVFLNNDVSGEKIEKDIMLQKLHPIFTGHSGENSQLLGSVYGLNKGKKILDVEYKTAILEWIQRALLNVPNKIDDDAKKCYINKSLMSENEIATIVKSKKKSGRKKLAIFGTLAFGIIMSISIVILLIIFSKNNDNIIDSTTDSANSTSDNSSVENSNGLNSLAEGDLYSMGYYPQTFVDDISISSELTSRAGDFPSAQNKYDWNVYDYYIEKESKEFMYYKDIDYDNDGTLDYRGVYYTQYRPKSYDKASNEDNSCQDDNGYKKGVLYWFKFEKIKWKVLKLEDDKVLLLTDFIIDSKEIDLVDPFNSTSFVHNGGTGYGNNYELSDIRSWLNNDFYNFVFNEQEKEKIIETTIDNSADTTISNPNNYVCKNTVDKLFLLSYSDASTYFTNNTRKTKGTDYAKCLGLKVYISNGNSFWWLRSPYNSGATSMTGVYYDGSLENSLVCDFDCGVRAACWIKK